MTQRVDAPQCSSEKKLRRGAMKIVTLNIRGAGLELTKYKWGKINNIIMRERIDILVVQETHLNEENTKELNETYEKKLHFISTLDETSSNKWV